MRKIQSEGSNTKAINPNHAFQLTLKISLRYNNQIIDNNMNNTVNNYMY